MNNFFTITLEFIWLFVGLVSIWASVNSFIKHDSKNGLIMALIALIGLLMFFARRTIRLRRKGQGQ